MDSVFAAESLGSCGRSFLTNTRPDRFSVVFDYRFKGASAARCRFHDSSATKGCRLDDSTTGKGLLQRNSLGPLTILTIKSIDHALIVTKSPRPQRLKAGPFVESACGGIGYERVDQNSRYKGVFKTPAQSQLHYLRSVATAEVGFLSDPNVDGP